MLSLKIVKIENTLTDTEIKVLGLKFMHLIF